MSRKQQIIPLPGRHRKHVGIVLQQQVGCTGDNEALGAVQIVAPLALGLEVLAGQIQRGIAKAQGVRLAAQEADANAGSFTLGIVFGAGEAFVIAKAPEDAGIGFEARQLANAGVERITVAADEVAGDHGKIGTKLQRFIDNPGKFGFA
jgi:hypothetical protein